MIGADTTPIPGVLSPGSTDTAGQSLLDLSRGGAPPEAGTQGGGARGHM